MRSDFCIFIFLYRIQNDVLSYERIRFDSIAHQLQKENIIVGQSLNKIKEEIK
jgi:hypothetical protein